MIRPRAHLLKVTAAAVIVAALGAALAIRGSWNKSETADERAHLTSGHSYWANKDYRLQPENGNLTQRIIALPNVIAGARAPSLETPPKGPTFVYAVGYQYMYRGATDAMVLLRRGRAAVALSMALIGLALFSISTAASGRIGGWITLVLFTFSPTVLANGALATSDMISAGCFVIAAWALWAALERITPLRIVASVLAVSALLLSKFSAPILIPTALLLVIIRIAERRALRVRVAQRTWTVRKRGQKAWVIGSATVIVASIAYVAIWAAYGFRYAAFNPDVLAVAGYDVEWSQLAVPQFIGGVISWMRDHRVLPEAYLYGTSHVLSLTDGRVQFLNGTVSTQGGWRMFFPYATLFKSTPAELMLGASGVGVCSTWLPRQTKVPRVRLRARRLLPFLVLAGCYSSFAIASPLNIGFRHFLPVVLVGFIVAGAVTLPLHRER